MNVRLLFLPITLSLLASEIVFSKDIASNPRYTFYGDVVAVDLPGHTITIKSGAKKLVFHITDETKISGRIEHISWNQVRIGEGATVVMKLGPGNVGIATWIRFDTIESLSKQLNLLAARTINGTVISGVAVNNYLEYQPPADAWAGGATLEHDHHDGVFLLEVQRDGTVGEVKMVKSLGDDNLNWRAIKWLKKWRFKPNTVSEVQMPMNHYQSRYAR